MITNLEKEWHWPEATSLAQVLIGVFDAPTCYRRNITEEDIKQSTMALLDLPREAADEILERRILWAIVAASRHRDEIPKAALEIAGLAGGTSLQLGLAEAVGENMIQYPSTAEAYIGRLANLAALNLATEPIAVETSQLIQA